MIKINDIKKAADQLGISLDSPGRGRPIDDSMQKRNLLMLAVYEKGQRAKGKKNNYGGEITYKELSGIFGIAKYPVSVGLGKARKLKHTEQYNQIKGMI